MITIEDVRQAASRTSPCVRKTPLVPARCMRDNPLPDGDLCLKLECLQATGSFKARGAANKLLSLTEAKIRRGIVRILRFWVSEVYQVMPPSASVTFTSQRW